MYLHCTPLKLPEKSLEPMDGYCEHPKFSQNKGVHIIISIPYLIPNNLSISIGSCACRAVGNSKLLSHTNTYLLRYSRTYRIYPPNIKKFSARVVVGARNRPWERLIWEISYNAEHTTLSTPKLTFMVNL